MIRAKVPLRQNALNLGGSSGSYLAWNISVEASCALGRCQRYPLYDVRSFSRQELVAPHELYLPYRPPPEVNPTKARDLSNKLCRNPTGEPNHVRVRQVAGRDVDEPFAARLGNAMVRYPSELSAKRVKSPVVRKHLREDGGRERLSPDIVRSNLGCEPTTRHNSPRRAATSGSSEGKRPVCARSRAWSQAGSSDGEGCADAAYRGRVSQRRQRAMAP